MVTDPISDMLTRIRNAQSVGKSSLKIPFSKLRLALAKILMAEGYLRGFKELGEGKDKEIRLDLKYVSSGEGIIRGMKRVSRPGRRVYLGKSEIPVVYGGIGIAVLSTSQGLLTGHEAKKMGLGGECLCKIW